jgi:hypothetical protein
MKINTYIIITILTLITCITLNFQCSRIQELKESHTNSLSLINSLRDSISTTVNKYGELEASKAALQATVKDLQEINQALTEDQKNLLTRLQEKTITATRIKTVTVVDTIKIFPSKSIDNYTFYRYNNKYFSFNASLMNSTLSLNSVRIWNTQTIQHERTKEGIVVRVSNTNPYITTTGLDSFIVPEPKRKNRLTGYLVSLGAGIITGILITN